MIDPLHLFCWLALCTAPDARATPQVLEHVEDLLEDVNEIGAPGIPGGVCAFSPKSFVVVVDANSMPVVAATEAGKGRALILGHNGYLGPAALESADTGAFFRNALQWLSGGKRKPRVVCPGKEDLAKALTELGLRAEASEELDGADCIVLDPGPDLTRERMSEIRTFVQAGGGLLASSTGWGWQQLNAQLTLARDLPGNRLLVPLGLAFTLETSSRTGENGFLTDKPVDPLTNTHAAWQLLREGPPDSERVKIAEKRVQAALACLPDHEPTFVLPLRRWFEDEARKAAASTGTLDRLTTHYGKREWRPLGEVWGEWHAIGPFQLSKGGKDVTVAKAPERALKDMQADGPGPDLANDLRGKGGRVAWRPLQLASDGHELDVGIVRFDKALTPPREAEGWANAAAAYLYRGITLAEARDISVVVGSDDGLRLWCNGELIADRSESRGIEMGEEPLVLPLRAGTNHVLVKVANREGVWGFRMRTDDAGEVDPNAVDAAIDRGVEHLKVRQLVDGSWGGHEKYQSGFSAYITYALIKSQVPVDDPSLLRAMAYIRAHEADYTYSESCRILALSAYEEKLGNEKPSPQLERAVERLVSWQEHTGLYGYPVYPDGGRPAADISNTIFVGLALRAAHKVGVDVSPDVWRGLFDGTLLCWENAGSSRRKSWSTKGGFSYRTDGHSTGSMTTAALSLILMAREALLESGDMDSREAREIDTLIESGLAWIDDHMAWNENPGHTGWQYFYIYGIERLGSLLEEPILGRVNWYASGARYLLSQQQDDGSWKAEQGAEAMRDTVLALLFLNRATAARTGRKESTTDLFAAEDPAADVHLRAKGLDPMVVWITGFSADVREELGWPGSRTRQPRLERVRYILRPSAGEDRVLAEVEAGGKADALQRFEARVTLPPTGTFEILAEVDALEPPKKKGIAPGRLSLTSDAIRVERPEPFDRAVLEYAHDAKRNLLRGSGVRLDVSTAREGKGAAKAIDGHHASAWLCEPTDTAPWFRATFARPITADGLLVSHPWPTPHQKGQSQPKRFELVLDGETTFEFEMHPDVMKKTHFELPAPREITTLELRILESRQRNETQPVGLSEIELVLGS